MNTETHERRQHERNPSRLPAWVCDHRTGLRSQGHVMNISVGGVYLVASCANPPQAGHKVDITIATNRDDFGGFELQHCQKNARVVRTDPLGYATGLALEFAGHFEPVTPQHQLMEC